MTTTGIKLENDFVGYIEDPNGHDVFGTVSEAINALHETIKFEEGLVAEYRKAVWSVGYMVFATNNVRNCHFAIIHRTYKVVRWRAVRAGDDEVIYFAGIDFYCTSYHIIKRNNSLFRHPKT